MLCIGLCLGRFIEYSLNNAPPPQQKMLEDDIMCEFTRDMERRERRRKWRNIWLKERAADAVPATEPDTIQVFNNLIPMPTPAALPGSVYAASWDTIMPSCCCQHVIGMDGMFGCHQFIHKCHPSLRITAQLSTPIITYLRHMVVCNF